MILGLLKEYGKETRVAILPEIVKTLTDMKVEVLVEKGAGETAFTPDADYESAGAKVVSRDDVFKRSEVLMQIQPPAEEDISKIRETQVWISAFNPLWRNNW
jgi:NAD(P) transhydrogenase subunit alpha